MKTQQASTKTRVTKTQDKNGTLILASTVTNSLNRTQIGLVTKKMGTNTMNSTKESWAETTTKKLTAQLITPLQQKYISNESLGNSLAFKSQNKLKVGVNLTLSVGKDQATEDLNVTQLKIDDAQLKPAANLQTTLPINEDLSQTPIHSSDLDTNLNSYFNITETETQYKEKNIVPQIKK
ncbi:4686_t:CDS:1 [Cetraspora pellucida]|uniref:4686_t:CDS:1 n=1 Tax=Cetraspora pellucida TaxID=1433469 RepID=A0ACA9QEY7_9GLOM|nr:4686_t:CDS:1 [Cetraspora pellucida]